MRNTLILIALLSGLTLQACSKDPAQDTDEEENGKTSSVIDDKAGADIVTDNDEDLVANATFDRTVLVVYSGNSATVSGESGDFGISISGAGVTITNNGNESVIYKLSGSSGDGYFKLYSSHRQEILLDNLTLTNKKGAAINVQSHKRTFMAIQGDNTLADGPSYTLTPSGEDEKAAVFAEGKLVLSGDGKLTVTATGKSGIASDDYVRFVDSPSVIITAGAGHGVRGKEAIIVSDGTIDVTVSGTGKKGFSSDTLVYIGGGATSITTSGSAGVVDGELSGVAGIKADLRFVMEGGTLALTSTGTGAKGISCDNVGYIKGGTLTVTASGANYGTSSSGGFGPGRGGHGGNSGSSNNSKSSKAIKFEGNLYISGGKVTARSSKHEGIEAKGVITLTGGEVYAYSSDDAINSGGNLTIEGGKVFAQSTGNDGLDANGNCYIKGGVIYAIGTGSPEVAIDANTEQQKKLYVSGGNLIAIGSLESGSSLSQTCWSAGTVKKGVSYSVYDNNGKVIYSFTTPTAVGSLTLVVSAPSLAKVEYGVTLDGGTTYLGGLYTEGASVSNGTSCSLSPYTGGGGMGGPGGGGYPGGW